MILVDIKSRSQYLLSALRAPLALESNILPREHILKLCSQYVFQPPLPPDGREAACMNAIIIGDEHEALTQVARGAYHSASDEVGLTLMHYAAQAGMLLLMHDLKHRGADINAKSIADESVLTYAVMCNANPIFPRHNLYAVTKFLIDNHVDVDARDNALMTATMHAALRGDTKLVQQLKAGGANINLPDKFDYNAMTHAALHGYYDTVRYFLESSVDPRRVIASQQATVHTMVSHLMNTSNDPREKRNLDDCARLLVRGEAIADAYQMNRQPLVKRDLSVAFNDVTAFRKAQQHATEYGLAVRSYACLEIAGALLGFESPRANSTAYHLLAAAYYNNTMVAMNMLGQHAPIDPQNHLGRTPLALAAMNGHPEMVGLLLNRGADTEISDALKMTPLMHAVINGDQDSVALLLAHRANPMAEDWQGMRPLDYAVFYHQDINNSAETGFITAETGFTPSPIACQIMAAMTEWEQAAKRVAVTEKQSFIKQGHKLS